MVRQNHDVLIEVKDLELEYESKKNCIKVLDNINLRIERGEFICLLGPSGCGKTTLLNIIAGYLKPSKGTCMMEEKLITGPDWRRGVVFQSPTLYPWMTVNENVEFGPKMKGLSKDEIRGIRLHFLEQVKLTGFGEKSTFELSGGMKQRVALARALANYPEVILMDEPLGALDALTRMNMQALVRDIWKKNKSTFFLITHDIDEALALGTRVLVMSKRPGKIIKEYSIDFTHTMFKDHNGHVRYEEKYITMKDEILDLINNQIE